MSIRVTSGIAAAAAAVVLSLSACAGGGGESDGLSAATAADAAPVDKGDGYTPADTDAESQDAGSRADLGTTGAGSRPVDAPTVAVISTGQVSLETRDVTKTRRLAQEVIDSSLGTTSEEETTTDDDGVAEATRLVIRVPSKHFSTAMTALEKVADLRSSTSSSEDVTTKVIDNEVRVRAQEKSLERMEALLAGAKSLNEVIAIESQLARRQADLDALKSTQAWLSDQTTLSTITLTIQLAEKETTDEGAGGFIGGLDRGWDGLIATLVGLGTLLGLTLPFVALAALLGVPVWLALRGVRRRRPRPSPEVDA